MLPRTVMMLSAAFGAGLLLQLLMGCAHGVAGGGGYAGGRGGYSGGDTLLAQAGQGCTDTNALIDKGGLKSPSDASLTKGLCVYNESEMHQPAGSPGSLNAPRRRARSWLSS